MGIAGKISVIGPRQIIRTIASVNRHGFTLLALLDSVKGIKEGTCTDDNEQVPYSELYARSLAMAYYLNERHGIGHGSKVAIVSVNCVPFVTSLFAASGLGADIFLLNPNQKSDHFESFLVSQEIDLIIGEEAIAGEFPNDVPFFWYHEKIDMTGGRSVRSIVKRKKGNITILSSGSKGIPKSERRKLSVAKYLDPLVDIIEKLHLKENSSVLISVPVFHGYGLAALLLSFFLGQKIRITKKFDTERTLKIMQDEKPDSWIAVPLMIQKVFSANAGSIPVKSIISGGDVLPSNIIGVIRKKSSAKIYNLYGTSETGVCTIATDDDLRNYPGTIGKTIPGIKTKIVGADGNLIAGEGAGQLLVKCAWSSESRNADHLPTGDLVSKNDQGYYFYKGRQDDMMVIGGENVYPIEVENILYRHPAVKWVKAQSRIDKDQITGIHIDVVLLQEASLSEKELIDWMLGKAPNYMVPRSVAILHEETEGKLM
jgi:fatty-acyl-CoA synthase